MDDEDDGAEPNLLGLTPSIWKRYVEASCSARVSCALFSATTAALFVLAALGAAATWEVEDVAR